MTNWIQKETFTQEEWELQARCFRDYSLYQSWAYLQVRAASKGQILRRILLEDETGPCCMAQVRIIRVPLLPLKIGYVQWGPIMRRTDRLDSIPVEALIRFRMSLVPESVHVLRIVPNLYTTDVAASWKEEFERAGWKHVSSVKPYHTFLFPLDIPEEAMRKTLHRKWRAALNKAAQRGLAVSESGDMKYLKILNELYRSSQEKKQFQGLEIEEYIRTQEQLLPNQKLNAVIISENETPLSIDVNSYLGDTSLGLFQSTSDRGLEINASYLAWWETFLAARRAGMKRYDMGGVDPEKNASVYQFKKRIGGNEVFQIGCFEAYANPFVERIWKLLSWFHQRAKG